MAAPKNNPDDSTIDQTADPVSDENAPDTTGDNSVAAAEQPEPSTATSDPSPATDASQSEEDDDMFRYLFGMSRKDVDALLKMRDSQTKLHLLSQVVERMNSRLRSMRENGRPLAASMQADLGAAPSIAAAERTAAQRPATNAVPVRPQRRPAITDPRAHHGTFGKPTGDEMSPRDTAIFIGALSDVVLRQQLTGNSENRSTIRDWLGYDLRDVMWDLVQHDPSNIQVHIHRHSQYIESRLWTMYLAGVRFPPIPRGLINGGSGRRRDRRSPDPSDPDNRQNPNERP